MVSLYPICICSVLSQLWNPHHITDSTCLALELTFKVGPFLPPSQIVKMLADAKCDVSMKDYNGMTAADVAEKAKESDIIKFLKVVCLT